MQPPQGVDMSPILAALARRQSGPLGGGGAPLQQQVSAPTHTLPGGGASTPAPANPVQPAGQVQNMPTQVQQGGGAASPTDVNPQLQAGQKAQGPMFDSETRDLAKSLVQRLLKGL